MSKLTMKQTMIWFLSFFLSIAAAAGSAGYAELCSLRGSKLVELEYDPDTKQFTLVDNSIEDMNWGPRPRSLKEENVQFAKHLSKHTFRGAKSQRQRSIESTKSKVTARQCPCDSTGATYCIVDSAMSSIPDLCGIPQRSSLFGVYPQYYNYTKTEHVTIECFEMPSHTVFVRNAWPVVILWYGALLIFFLATANGKYAQMYIFNTLCPCSRVNERYVDRALRDEADMRMRLRHLQSAAERADSIAEGPGRFLRRTGGMRVRRNFVDDQQLTEEEQRDEAMRRWIEAAEAFGILNAREVSELSQHSQPMEYVLRTKKFNLNAERAKRKTVNTNLEDEKETASCDISTPVKSQSDSINKAYDEKQGPSTPETVDSEVSRFEFDEPGDSELTSGESPNNVPTSSPVDSLQAESADEESGIVTDIQNEPSDELGNESFDCTICLSEVCDGEEVGVLSCSHIFHVDCLREWIIRRNACPLCQAEICTPRPVEGDMTLGSGQDSSPGESDTSSVAGSRVEILIHDFRRHRPTSVTTSFSEGDVRLISDTMTSPSRRNRREYNQGRIRRQQMEDPFSFSGW